MSNPIVESFSQFVNLCNELVDPDEGVTLARITPILGDQHNVISLGVISRFLTNFFYETIDVTLDSYVVLNGVRLPVTAFRFLRELAEVASTEELQTTANALATLGTGATFPDAFVDLNEFYGDGSSGVSRQLTDLITGLTKDAIVNINRVSDVVVEQQLSTSFIPEVGHASSDPIQ